jgi:8-oxo-dGTP pyrophosphatase MutT (NUDIX family)
VLHASALDTLRSWAAPDSEQERLRLEYLEHLTAHDDAMWRTCGFGHLTGSAIVVNAERTAVALLFHPRVGRWLQAGGHCEVDDASLTAVALREATEEFGVTGLQIDSEPIDLDIHAYACPKGTPNRHLDVRFRCVAPSDAQLVCSDESIDVRWFAYDELPEGLDPSTERLIARSRV